MHDLVSRPVSASLEMAAHPFFLVSLPRSVLRTRRQRAKYAVVPCRIRPECVSGVLSDMCLRTSLSLSILVVVVLTLLAGAWLTYLGAVHKVEEEMAAAVAVGARIAGNAVDDPEEWRNPRESLVLLVGDFHGDRHLRATWVGAGGVAVMSSVPAAPTANVPKWFSDLIAVGERRIEVSLPPAFDGAGTFHLTTDPLNEIGEVWRDSWNTLTILALLSGLVVVIVNVVIYRALRPLDRLVSAFDAMSRSVKPPRLPEHGPSDLVQVYAGFNDMVEKLAASEAMNRRLNEQLQSVQDEERADIARDLHDEIGPFLFSADVEASAIDRLIESGDRETVRSHVRSIREAIRHMQVQVRGLLGRLRAEALVDVGLEDAIENLADFWRRRFPDISFEVAVLDAGFGPERDAVIYRVVQEALSNAVRHGKPQNVRIEVMETDNGIAVEVFNDGTAFDTARAGSGFGLIGMRERLEALGGVLLVENATQEQPSETEPTAASRSSSGVRVLAKLPPPAAVEALEAVEAVEAVGHASVNERVTAP